MGILEHFLKEYWIIKVKSQDILKKSIQILNNQTLLKTGNKYKDT